MPYIFNQTRDKEERRTADDSSFSSLKEQLAQGAPFLRFYRKFACWTQSCTVSSQPHAN